MVKKNWTLRNELIRKGYLTPYRPITPRSLLEAGFPFASAAMAERMRYRIIPERNFSRD